MPFLNQIEIVNLTVPIQNLQAYNSLELRNQKFPVSRVVIEIGRNWIVLQHLRQAVRLPAQYLRNPCPTLLMTLGIELWLLF